MKRNLILALMFVVTIVAVSCGFQAPTYIPNGSGADVRNAINNALKSVMSQHSAPTEPGNAQPFMYWVDTSTTPPTTRQRNAANTAWDIVLPALTTSGTAQEYGAFELEFNEAGSSPLSKISLSSNVNSLYNSIGGGFGMVQLTNNNVTITTSGGKLYLRNNSAAPANATEACSFGETRWDSDYEYRCITTNTWKRIPMSTW